MQDPFKMLESLDVPRPFGWYGFITVRRAMYGFASLALLVVCVGLPMLVFIGELQGTIHLSYMRPNQIALYFGALVVVCFARYSYVLNQLWNESKWLARHGRIEEANLLWVVASTKRLVVTYRFWTPDGTEIKKETVIDADGKNPLADLKAGDVVPVLYDPRGPRRRSMLWAEIERYVTLGRADLARAESHNETGAEAKSHA